MKDKSGGGARGVNNVSTSSKHENAKRGRVGMDAAEKFLPKFGFSDVKRVDRMGEGCDFEAVRDSVRCKIEVKTTGKEGVPDAFETEFTELDKHPKFRPDYLLVVRLGEGWKLKGAHLVSKNDVDRYKKRHKIVKHVKFSSEFKKDLWEKKIGKWLDWTA